MMHSEQLFAAIPDLFLSICFENTWAERDWRNCFSAAVRFFPPQAPLTEKKNAHLGKLLLFTNTVLVVV